MIWTIGFCMSSVAWYILSNRLLCFVFQLWWHRPSIFSYKHRPGQLCSLCPTADASLCIHALAGQRTNKHGCQCGTHRCPTQTFLRSADVFSAAVCCLISVYFKHCSEISAVCRTLTVHPILNSYQYAAELMSTKQLACWVYAGWYTQEVCLYGSDGLS